MHKGVRVQAQYESDVAVEQNFQECKISPC